MRSSSLKTQVSARPVVESLEGRQLLSAGADDHFFTQTNLVSNSSAAASAQHTDAKLINPWGLAYAPNGPFWVANNGTGSATLYNGAGGKQQPTVDIPGVDGMPDSGNPTGMVYNDGTGFVISKNNQSAPAIFMFVNEDGLVTGWNPSVDGTHAVVALDDSDEGAIYKGATLANRSGQTNLYAADFHNGEVAVYDSSFHDVDLGAGAFDDPQLPSGYAPFNVQTIPGNKIAVTFAKQDSQKEDEVHGKGLGFVDIFDTSGHLLQRLKGGQSLNAPWGVAVAPKGFGRYSGDILVGNFGSGTIVAFGKKHGNLIGTLQSGKRHNVRIEGLWALSFGNGASAGGKKELFFSAGIDNEAAGLFGKLTLKHKKSTSSTGGSNSDGGYVYP